jgi:1-acyl-sn-glycerol-3-phosphate acyltransferase
MWPAWVILGVALAVAFAAWCRLLLWNPRGDVETGLLWRFLRLYARLFHRLRVEGGEHIPRTRHPGPLIIVSNHTAGVDPLLIQAACVFEIRWIMAADMQVGWAEPFWRWAGVISVDRRRGDAGAAREAIRHVKEGGVLGIFPEGGLERPARTIIPFEPGVGLIIRRTGARVLPVIVDGTPIVDAAWTSLVRPGRARIRFMPPIDYSATKLSAQEITEDLRRRYAEWTGWAMSDEQEWRKTEQVSG